MRMNLICFHKYSLQIQAFLKYSKYSMHIPLQLEKHMPIRQTEPRGEVVNIYHPFFHSLCFEPMRWRKKCQSRDENISLINDRSSMEIWFEISGRWAPNTLPLNYQIPFWPWAELDTRRMSPLGDGPDFRAGLQTRALLRRQSKSVKKWGEKKLGWSAQITPQESPRSHCSSSF